MVGSAKVKAGKSLKKDGPPIYSGARPGKEYLKTGELKRESTLRVDVRSFKICRRLVFQTLSASSPATPLVQLFMVSAMARF
jgi:hypothetical protein